MKTKLFSVLITLFFLPIFIYAEDCSNTCQPVEFGVDLGESHVFMHYAQSGKQFMPIIRDLNTRVSRVIVFWSKIEPKPPVNGKHTYNWKLVDALLKQIKEGDVILLTVTTTSKWATETNPEGTATGSPIKSDSRCAADIKKAGLADMGMSCYEAYADFIRDLVKHTQGKIKYWNRDTEPALERHWPKDRPKEYVETQKIFYNAVKSVQPGAVVIGGGHAGGFNSSTGEPGNKEFFDYFLKESGDYFDMFDVRLYADKYYNPNTSIEHRVRWFREKMKSLGYQKPIAATEYGGPTTMDFPEWGQLKKLCNERGYKELLEYYDCKKELEEEGLVPDKLKMFFHEASLELDKKRDRIECRDITQRTVLAAAAGVKYLGWWNIFESQSLRNKPVHPIFGKLRLMNMEDGAKRPAYYCYQRMADKLFGMCQAERINTENKDIYFYKISRKNKEGIYVLWHKRDLFSGEEEPPVGFKYNLGLKEALITDVFGKVTALSAKDGILNLKIMDTPLFIEKVSE
ncbi:MAG: hypothetical protein AB1481_02710 [Candidatus Omnitrophota bacterium]